ncbi:MAG: hypothetical protein AAGF60_11605 [Pseudomonadota bacterium]
MKKTLSVAAAAVLGGCAAPFPTLEVPDAPVGVSFVTQPTQHRVVQGTTETTVRAFVKARTQDGKDASREVPATCTLASDHIRGTVPAPRKVALPKYDQTSEFEGRGVPPSILFTCKDAEGRSGTALLTANPRQVSTVTGNTVVGLIVLAGTAAAAATANWRYDPAVRVVME